MVCAHCWPIGCDPNVCEFSMRFAQRPIHPLYYSWLCTAVLACAGCCVPCGPSVCRPCGPLPGEMAHLEPPQPGRFFAVPTCNVFGSSGPGVGEPHLAGDPEMLARSPHPREVTIPANLPTSATTDRPIASKPPTQNLLRDADRVEPASWTQTQPNTMPRNTLRGSTGKAPSANNSRSWKPVRRFL